jgi:hypothetical protein
VARRVLEGSLEPCSSPPRIIGAGRDQTPTRALSRDETFPLQPPQRPPDHGTVPADVPGKARYGAFGPLGEADEYEELETGSSSRPLLAGFRLGYALAASAL